MRHLIGILLAVVMAGVLYFAAAWGYLRLTTLTSPLSRMPAGGGSLLSDHRMLAGLIAVGGTGLLAGILIAAPRISPLAAGLPGLLLVGLSVLYLVSVRRADELIPLRSHVFGTGFETLLARGLLGAAGLAMIVPLFVPSRWRSRRSAELADEFGPDGTDTGELVGVVPGFGGMPGPGASAGPADPTAPAGMGIQPAPFAVPAPPAAPATGNQAALPRRSGPPGIVY